MLRIEGLSADILTRIVENFPVSDQMSFRLVSRRFNDVISPRVFRDITLYTDRISAGHHPFPFTICPFIISLKLHVVDYQRLDRADWRNKVQNRWRYCNMRPNRVYRKHRHRNQAWEVYKSCREDLQNDTARSMTLLSSNLKQMLKLRQLRITDVTDELRTEPYSNSQCMIQNCQYQNYDHTVLAVPLIPGLQRLGVTVLSHVMRGLSDMLGRLPHLVISTPTGSHFMQSGFSYNALVRPPVPVMLQSPMFVSVVSSLTRLHLQLCYDEWLERGLFTIYGVPHVSQMLSRATNLVHLELEMVQDWENESSSLADFRAVLQNCAFHRLTSLSIGGLESTGAELLAFTDGSPNLETIGIDSYELNQGSWAAILDHWSMHMQFLEHVHLINLFFERSASDLNEPKELLSENGPALLDLQARIQNFILTGVSNPLES